MSINYQNDQINPVIIIYDHKYKSTKPKLNKINKGGIWSIESPVVNDLFEISLKGVVEYKNGDVIIDENKNIKIRELKINYNINNEIYTTIFYVKIIPRTILITLNNEIIIKEYDGTSLINNSKIKYNFISYGKIYKFNYKKIIDIEAKFYKDNKEVTYGGSQENLLDISLNIINKSNNYEIDYYSYGTSFLNFCKNIGYIKKIKLFLEPIKNISKVYDGNISINVDFKILNLPKDKTIELDCSNIYFEDQYVGKNKKIIIEEIKIINPEYNQIYELVYDNIELFGTIKKKELYLNFIIEEREYNSSQYANIRNVEIKGINNFDDVHISKKIIAQYEDSNCGIDKPVTISNIKLKGNDYKNYKVEPIILSKGTIFKKKYELKINNIFKEYDGTNLGVITDNEIVCEVLYASSNVGTHIVSIENIKQKNNYEITYKKKFFGTINKRKLIVNFNVLEKIYDGKTNIDVDYDIKNLVNNDTISLEWEICKLKKPNAGENIVEIRNIKIIGENSNKYYFNKNINLETYVQKKKIEPKIELCSIDYGIENLKVNEIVLFDENIKINKEELVIKKLNNNEALIENINFYTNKKENYIIDDKIITNIKITPKTLDVDFELEDKIFDGTSEGKILSYKINGIINNDDVYLKIDEIIVHYQTIYSTKKTKVEFSNINIYGKDSMYYNISNTKAQYNFIKPRELMIDFYIENKFYNSKNDAKIQKYTFMNSIGNEKIYIDSYQAEFEEVNVSDKKIKVNIFNVKISGKNSNCYTPLKNYESYGFIIPCNLLLEPIGKPKIFDDTNTVYIEDIKILNLYNNDDVKITSYEAYYSNIEKDEVTIQNIKIDGMNIKNYCFNDKITCYVKIKPKKIDILYNTIEKIYDGNNYINVELYVNIPNINISYSSANFVDANCGKNKSVVVNGIILDNKFYETEERQILYGEIKKKEIIPIFEVNTKNYDGTSIANVKVVGFEGIINNDIVLCESMTSYYTEQNASNQKINIIVENILIDNINYYVNTKEVIQGYIQPTELIPIIKIESKEYDGTKNGKIKSYILKGKINDDDVKINENELIIEYENEYASDDFKEIKVKNINLIGKDSRNYYILNEV